MAELKPGNRVITGSGQRGNLVDICLNSADVLLDSGLRMIIALDAIKEIAEESDNHERSSG